MSARVLDFQRPSWASLAPPWYTRLMALQADLVGVLRLRRAA